MSINQRRLFLWVKWFNFIFCHAQMTQWTIDCLQLFCCSEVTTGCETVLGWVEGLHVWYTCLMASSEQWKWKHKTNTVYTEINTSILKTNHGMLHHATPLVTQITKSTIRIWPSISQIAPYFRWPHVTTVPVLSAVIVTVLPKRNFRSVK